LNIDFIYDLKISYYLTKLAIFNIFDTHRLKIYEYIF
jgi:hypothetical protein